MSLTLYYVSNEMKTFMQWLKRCLTLFSYCFPETKH